MTQCDYQKLLAFVKMIAYGETTSRETLEADARDLLDDVDGVYCKECSACGCEGCCNPPQCKYLNQYQGDYDDLVKANAELQAKFEKLERYNEQLHQASMNMMVAENQAMGFYDNPPGPRKKLVDLLPESKRKAWEARMKEFKEREDE